jgi:hypothetical protein
MNKEIKYIPGDLVMTNGVPLGTAKDVVYRVTSSDPSKTLELDDGTVLKGTVRLDNLEGAKFGDKGYLLGDCGAWVKDIIPIPLTPKILEKNGWKLSHGFYLSPNEEGAEVGLSSQTGYVWEAYIRRHPFRSNINSVSDLQHLLFGLGLNSEMEV